MIMSMKSDPLLSWLSLTVGGASLQGVESTCPTSGWESSMTAVHQTVALIAIIGAHLLKVISTTDYIHHYSTDYTCTSTLDGKYSYPVKLWIII